MIIEDNTYIVRGGDLMGEVRLGTDSIWTFPGIPGKTIWYQTRSGNSVCPKGDTLCVLEDDYFGDWHIMKLACPLVCIPDASGYTDGVFGGTDIERIIFPPELRVIGARAFQGCEFLKSLELPEDLMGIGKYAFSGCTRLSYIWSRPIEAPELGTGCFGRVSLDIPVYTGVPENYGGWRIFKNIKKWTI